MPTLKAFFNNQFVCGVTSGLLMTVPALAVVFFDLQKFVK
jgi:hypothetical protein